MQAKSPKPRNTKDLGRCQHTNGNGRCRMPAAGRSGLCFEHARFLRDDIDHSAVLTRFSRGFQTVEGINFALGDLFVLLAQGRISPRRAAVLTFMASQMLRTLVLMRENHGKFIHRSIGAAQMPTKHDYMFLDPRQDEPPQPEPPEPAAEENPERNTDQTEPNEAHIVEACQESVPPATTLLPATRLEFLDAVDQAIEKANANKTDESHTPTSVAPEEVLNE